MKWEQINKQRRDDLLRLYESDVATGSSKIILAAQKLQMNPRTLQRRLRDHRQEALVEQIVRTDDLDPSIKDILKAVPASPTRQYVDYVTVNGDDWMIISDIEIPDHDPTVLMLTILTAMRFGIKKLIIAGDLLATDQATLNHWVNTIVEGDDAPYAHCIKLVKMILKAMLAWFDTIILITGNHDDRVAKATQGEVHLGMFLDEFIDSGKLMYSRYPYLWLETSRGPIKVIHPQNFSSDPIVLGQQLYDVEPKKCHIILGHCHRHQTGFSKDGAYEIYGLGLVRDPKRTKYKQFSANKHRQWDQGILMIRNGYIHSLPIKSTDWPWLLGETLKRVA